MSPIAIILLILLILLLCGTGPWTPWGANWGYAPGGFFLVLIIILIVLALTGRL